jgi:hypothetical protein
MDRKLNSRQEREPEKFYQDAFIEMHAVMQEAFTNVQSWNDEVYIDAKKYSYALVQYRIIPVSSLLPSRL